jgi:hypothetical protein
MAAKKKSTKSPSRRKPLPKAAWERGYNGHVLWQGKVKLGRITVHAGAKEKYTWQAGTRVGSADSLARARKDVEFAALVAHKQRDLFE